MVRTAYLAKLVCCVSPVSPHFLLGCFSYAPLPLARPRALHTLHLLPLPRPLRLRAACLLCLLLCYKQIQIALEL